MFGTALACGSIFFSLTNSKCRSSISDKNLVSELRCARNVKYTPDFEDRTEEKVGASH